jgi:hypothetical protein
MAYTSTDLDDIIAAIVALAKGQRVVSVRLDGKDIQYGQVDLPALRSLRAEIENELAVAAGVVADHAYLTGSKGY